MREGSLEAPTRHRIDWQNPEFWNEESLEKELRRVYDICHGCRRCFNLCDSFPKLFDFIDQAPNESVEELSKQQLQDVVDACTLCDMCFMTKCPYVPPHEWNLDFPHLMLRARAIETRKNGVKWNERALTQTDRNGKLAALVAPLANWGSKEGNALTRPVMEKALGIHREARLPKFNTSTFKMRDRGAPAQVNRAAPAFGKRKAALYATCFVNYNDPPIGMAARAVLNHNGVETRVEYPRCCGMPQLEHGEIEKVAANARRVAAHYSPLIDEGWDVVALVPSCALMFKFEWPLIVPDDPLVKKLAQATFDITEYVVDIAKRHGLAEGLKPLDGGVAVHLACHARAQNMGPKAAEMLRLIPGADIQVIERCSGHGGSWGIMKETFETGVKVGKAAARAAAKSGKAHLASECPLAGDHLAQVIDRLGESERKAPEPKHPIELFAMAYGLA
ncbi:MAG: glycerol-3-phosphate dehydrogenase [Alphaproteobacteria bacterium]|nr:glycerol-3-phosphate dehydrogenase [Alphaproteobacteria bacterium]